MAAITTVTSNEQRFSKREVAQAQAARKLQQRLAFPPDSKLIRALHRGTFLDTGVLPSDVTRATDIYGPCVEALKGRTTTRKAPSFPIETLTDRATSPQSAYVDLFYANKDAFLITVVKPLGHIMVTAIDKADTPTLRKALRTHLGTYRQRGLQLSHVYSDNEKGLLALGLDFAGAGIVFDQAGPGMHVSIIERCIRTVKEGVRATLAGLGYPANRKLLRYLVTFVVNRINMFPSDTRTDALSAFQLLYRRSVNAKLDAHLEFGAYYQVSVRAQDNTMAARTYGAIGVAQHTNGTGTCGFLALHNGLYYAANHFTLLPMPQEVLDTLTASARRDNIGPHTPTVLRYHGNIVAGPADHDEPDDPPESPLAALSPLPLLDLPPDISDSPTGIPTLADTLPTAPAATDHRGGLTGDTLGPTGDTTGDAMDIPTPLPAGYVTPQDLPPPNTPDITPITTLETIVHDSPPPSTPHSRPSRIKKRPERYGGIHITAARAIKEDSASAYTAIDQELNNLREKEVFRGVHIDDLTAVQRKRIVRSAMNITRKVTPASDGSGRTFDKVKARLVVDGSKQDRSLYAESETSSPTASTSAVLIVAALAAGESRKVITLDIAAAYLNAKMTNNDPAKTVYVAIDATITARLISIDPTMRPFIKRDGGLIVQLDKALYGCLESAVLWYDELCSSLNAIGFSRNDADPCVLNRTTDGTQDTIVVYVDDLMITSTSARNLNSITSHLKDRYRDLKITQGPTHNYLGMVMTFNKDRTVTINQTGMVKDIVTATPLSAVTQGAKKKPKTPGAPYLFEITDSSPLLAADEKAAVHSAVAKILFISGRARPDLLTSIAFLTKRVTKSTEEDGRKLDRVINYMSTTPELSLTLGCTFPPRVTTWVDASFGVHMDKKSHTGVCSTLGLGMWHSKSTAQKLNTTSSTEAELVGVAKGIRQSLWAANFLTLQGYPRQPVRIYQDNMSTIKLIEKGRSTSELTRHIDLGFFWLHDLLGRELITIEYCPTTQMVADFLSKPLQGALFQKMRDKLMGVTSCTVTPN